MCSKPRSLVPLLKSAAALHSYQHHEYPELKPRSFLILLNCQPRLYLMQQHLSLLLATPVYFWLFTVWLCQQNSVQLWEVYISFLLLLLLLNSNCGMLCSKHQSYWCLRKIGKISSTYPLKRIQELIMWQKGDQLLSTNKKDVQNHRSEGVVGKTIWGHIVFTGIERDEIKHCRMENNSAVTTAWHRRENKAPG